MRKEQSLLLSLLVLLAAGIGGTEVRPMNLRGGVRTDEHSTGNVQGGVVVDPDNANEGYPSTTRKLQNVATTVFNQLIALVAPNISEKVTYAVNKHFNSYDFTPWLDQGGMQTTKNLESANARNFNNDSVCGGSDLNVQVEFAVQSVTGLGENLTIESIEFVPGSQEIELVFQGLQNGAKWSGQWVLDVSFTELTANVNAKFNTSCGDTDNTLGEELSLNGTMVFRNIQGQGVATINGDTERMVFFPTTSQFTSAHIDEVTFAYDVAQSAISFSNASTAGLNFDAEALVGELFHEDGVQTELDEYFESLFTQAIQDEIDFILPRPLVG